LTNATSPLTSLNFTFKLPVLGFVSLRGEPGVKDEPQHELMGQITEKMLALMKVEWAYLPEDEKEATNQLRERIDISRKAVRSSLSLRKESLEMSNLTSRL
jgi:phosphonopyruvate decarboxylase